MTTRILEISVLSCARGDRALFEGLGARIGAGELLYVAGTNGSGKTTLLRTVAGLARPAFGEIRWNGQLTRVLGDEFRRCIAYVGHLDGVQGELTLTENLSAYQCVTSAGLPSNGCDSIEEILEQLGLTPYRSFPAKLLSQGQRRRLALARLFVTDKPLWILDEPFTALDVRSCRLVSELLAKHLVRGGLAMISSHQEFDIVGAAYERIDLDSLRAANPYGFAPTGPAQPMSAGQPTA